LPLLARLAAAQRRRAVLELGRQRPVAPGHARRDVHGPAPADGRQPAAEPPVPAGAPRPEGLRERMTTSSPGIGKVLTMVLFALSCFGLLLFFWLSFGGPVPLKPKGYEFKVAFPEAAQLGLAADVCGRGATMSSSPSRRPRSAASRRTSGSPA